MNRGDLVRVRAFGGEVLERRVVDDLGKHVVVCSEAEFRRAAAEHREPQGIGFPKSDVVEEPVEAAS